MSTRNWKEKEAQNGDVVGGSGTGSLSDSMDGVVSHLNMKGPIKRRHSIHNIARQLSLRRKQKLQRLVNKNGMCNVVHTHVPSRGLDFLADIFTTLVDLKWRWVLLMFSLAYIGGWVGFTVPWYGLVWYHGDIGYLSNNDTLYENWEPCVYNVENFIGAFLFSVETQTTIGYGYRGVTEECWLGGTLVVLQSVFSCLVDAVMIGCIFAKIARPKKRAATIKFSRHAVIAERDGKLCLMFRLGDIRQSHIYEAHIRGQLIGPKVTDEGECIPLHSYHMNFGNDTGEDRIFLVWPIIICHVIDEKSPLYTVSADDLLENNFEIIVCLEGVLEQTGLVTQARTSYLPSEILWGHRFSSHLISIKNSEQFKVDYREFNSTYPIQNMPRCSAAELERMREPDSDFIMDTKPINSPTVKVPPTKNCFQSNLPKSTNGAYNGNGRIRFADEDDEYVKDPVTASVESLSNVPMMNGVGMKRSPSRESPV
ncbi:ATP-sensitive inward rectifier potassium channel 12-like [Diadema setosum]|uniref:ATP-sensitive inward rectifier potassium channel 12-like n=1 Tax=Diadema setosum TaxID=31175 RepID=UPI003B3BA23E